MNRYAEFGPIVKGHTIYKKPDGVIVPGVSTITGQLSKPRLIDWAANVTRRGLDHRAILEESGRVGTLAHEMVQCHLMGGEPNLANYSATQVALARNSMAKFLQYCERHKAEPLFMEHPLVSEEYGYGGTPDFYGLLDGVPAQLDWKTGSNVFEGHRLQAAAYWNLLVENGHEVKRVRILRIGREEGGGYQESGVGRLEERLGVFLDLLSAYQGRLELGEVE